MYYGIDIGGTKIELAAFNEKLEKLYTERVPTPQTDSGQRRERRHPDCRP